MKKTVIIVAPIVVFFLIVLKLSGTIVDEGSPSRSRLLFPLREVDLRDNANYVVVRKTNGRSKIEIADDVQSIKRSKARVFMYNTGTVYGSTSDGELEVYKDGKRIFYDLVDEFPYTLVKSYGTLKFREINHAMYALIQGGTIVEQSANYVIINYRSQNSPSDYYICYVHEGDLYAPESVRFFDGADRQEDVSRP